MAPKTILNRLAGLAARERLLRFVWGAARVVAVAGLLLVTACLADWVYDRYADTPWLLRLGLSSFQMAAAAVLLVALVVVPLFTWLSYSRLAAWVEAAFPGLRGRVRSAVELNAAGARTDGMSEELIAEVTRQAEEEMRSLPVRRAVDGRRWKWALAVVAPVALLVGLPWLFAGETCWALLQRQFLADVDIPRSVAIDGHGQRVWPTGEKLTVRFLATGPGAAAGAGTMRLSGEELPTEYFPLAVDEKATRERTDGGIVYQAEIPPTPRSFEAMAWVGDGRTKRPVPITLEPRPDLADNEAWLILPGFVGLRPDGKPYEELQVRGDIEGFRGCRARVVTTANKPLGKATLEILSVDQDSPHERVSRTLEMKTADDTNYRWSAEFELLPGETAYRILMVDEHGYKNVKIPRRSITLAPDEPPTVTLLPERFARPGQTSHLQDTEAEGIPVVPGIPIRLGYKATTNLSLTRAVLRYRILKPGADSQPENLPWQSLPLREVVGTDESGLYDAVQARFANGDERQEIEFAATDSPDPAVKRGRLAGGGRFLFQTRGLPDLQLKDRIEYYVEVYDSRPGSKPGASGVRVKDVVDTSGLLEWLDARAEEKKRLQQIKTRQEEVLGLPSTDSP